MRNFTLPRLLLASALACCAALPFVAGCGGSNSSKDLAITEPDQAVPVDLSTSADLSQTDASQTDAAQDGAI